VATACPGLRHDDGTAFVRSRRGELIDVLSGQRMQDNTFEGSCEMVGPGVRRRSEPGGSVEHYHTRAASSACG
jgi:hypothetical protein